MSAKPLHEDQIRANLDTLDALEQSGLGLREFALRQGISYMQVRAWLSHAPRWRAKLQGQPHSAKPNIGQGFVQLKVSAQPRQAKTNADTNAKVNAKAKAHSAHHIRIDCAHGARSASVHWPSNASAQCAQWLLAYLS
jgi:hypothetical protein